MQTAPTWDRPRSLPALRLAAERGVHVLLFGPAGRARRRRAGRRGGRCARVGRQEPRPCAGGAIHARGVDRAGSKGRGRRSRGCACVRGRHRSGARGRPVQRQARARHPPSGARSADTRSPPAHRGDAARRRRERAGAPGAPGPVCLHGRGFRERRARRRAPARRSALKRRGVRARQRAGRASGRGARATLAATGSCALSATSRAATSSGGGRRDRHRRLHRQHRPEVDGGCLPDDVARGQRRRDCPRRGASWAECCCAPRYVAFATKSIPKERAGPICWVCVVSRWSRTGALPARGFAQAILRAERGVREDVVGATQRARGGRRAEERLPVSGDPASLASE